MALGLGALFQSLLKLGGTKGAQASLGSMAQKMFGSQRRSTDEVIELSEEERRQRALEFVGAAGPDYYQDPTDDAPNIVMPAPLIQQTSTSSILPQQTIVPQIIEAPRGTVVRGLGNIVLEIERINTNISAITRAMSESALLEKRYRDEMIKDRRELLAQRGKARSRRRTGRRARLMRNVFSPVRSARRRVGGALKQTGEAFLLGAGLEIGAFIAEAFKKFISQGETKPVEPGSAEEIRLATGILTEGSGDQDQADIFQVVANRMKKDNKSATEVLGSPGQFQGVFGRRGAGNEAQAIEEFKSIKTIEDAAKFLGVSEAEAEKRIKRTLGNLRNQRLLEAARRDVGGALQFRGNPDLVRQVNTDTDPDNDIEEVGTTGRIPNSMYRGQGGNQFLTGPNDPKIAEPANTGTILPPPPAPKPEDPRGPQERASLNVRPLSEEIAMAPLGSLQKARNITTIDLRKNVSLPESNTVNKGVSVPEKDPGGGGLYENYMLGRNVG